MVVVTPTSRYLVIISVAAALSRAENLEDVNIEYFDKLACLLMGGKYIAESEIKSPYKCIDKPETEEECLAKGGKIGEFCMDESKCVGWWNKDQCVIDLSTDLKTPEDKKAFKGIFDSLTAALNQSNAKTEEPEISDLSVTEISGTS